MTRTSHPPSASRMRGNLSSAVRQARIEPGTSRDDFPTPPWATRALLERISIPDGAVAREPAANRGHMVRPMREAFRWVDASDIHNYGTPYKVRDYLDGEAPKTVDWTITNPPFRLADRFIARALETSRCGVAVIVRLAFLEGIERYRSIFSTHPPSVIYQFTERVVMHKGKLSRKGSTATAYAWLVWDFADPVPGCRFAWIEPCRKRLERPADYMAVPPVPRARCTPEGPIIPKRAVFVPRLRGKIDTAPRPRPRLAVPRPHIPHRAGLRALYSAKEGPA